MFKKIIFNYFELFTSLRHIFVAGEHCDHETMQWIKEIVKKPIFDHWWQTETGWPITSMCAGLMSKDELNNVPIGVSGKAVPGYDGIKLILECYFVILK